MPNVEAFQTRWQELSEKNGLPGFYFISYADDYHRLQHHSHLTCEASILSLKTEVDSIGSNVKLRKLTRFFKSYISQILHRNLNVYDYENILNILINPICKEQRIYPVIIPNWDNTPRRGYGSLIFHNSTCDLFKKHVKQVINLIEEKPIEDQVIFLKSWNEWAEGNYMEPDLKYGKGFINALSDALNK
jgi:hypothetical protein